MEKPELDDPDYNPEEEVAEGDWKLVDLPDQEVKSGEEETEEVFNARAKLYRWRDAQWKERGVGQAKVLKHKATGKYSFILRQDATMKLMAYFYVYGKGLCSLQKLQTAEKTVFWSCIDMSEGSPKLEKFCLRVKTNEELEQFQKAFELAYEENSKLSWEAKGEKKEETKEEEKKEEAKPEKKEEAKEEQKAEERKDQKAEEKKEEKAEDKAD